MLTSSHLAQSISALIDDTWAALQVHEAHLLDTLPPILQGQACEEIALRRLHTLVAGLRRKHGHARTHAILTDALLTSNDPD